MHFSRITGWILLPLIAGSIADAQVPQTPPQVARLMQDRQYDEAIAAIGGALERKQGAPDYLVYLKARALHFQKKYGEAIAAFDLAAEKFPDSKWARKARLAKGISYARKGDFQEAALLYRAEARRLLSLDRKQELATIYREYADAYFRPQEDTETPDYPKALEFYTKALTIGPNPETQIEIELRIARCRYETGRYDKAAELYERFINEHVDHPMAVEARYRLGESLLAAGKPAEARRTWRDLLRLHADSPTDRLPEAAFNISLTYNIPTPENLEQLDLGVAALESFIAKYPNHEQVGLARLRIAQSYQNLGRHEDAAARLKAFLGEPRFAGGNKAAESRYLLAHAYKMQGEFVAAEAAWSDFLAKHPTHQLWNNAHREVIDTEYLRAHAQYAKRQYEQARRLWTGFLAEHPLDPRSNDVLYRFGEMNYAEEKWQEAIADWRRLVEKYPQSDQASRAQFAIALTLEKRLGKLARALDEYRKVTWGSHVSDAQAAIARLTSKRMTIVAERVFRSNEVPAITLTTRNIDRVTVRAYSLDLETYFRKMHLASGIEKLDIALIDPDRTFEFKVPDYREYAEIESRIELSLPADGPAADSAVMAVTVSSKTLEATSLVVQSDLDIVVKSSRDEVFVFAENVRTGQPWPKARILISDGQHVLSEGHTGDDGVFRKTDGKLESAADVRVFAVAGIHTASNVVSLEGVGVAKGLSNKGYVYTERPVYRPGQMVHVRGLLRTVVGDAYRIAKGKQYRVEVYDLRNRALFRTKVALGEFGAFHTNFVLPAASPQGRYRIQVRDNDRESYQGSFQVRPFRRKTVRLQVDTTRAVYYRGEDIQGTIRASFYYGAPLPGREIRYQLAGGRVQTGKTDADGTVHFRLPTREYRESQVLTLVAELPERDLRSGRSLFLATQGFTLSATCPRPVYLAGEAFELTVISVDAAGKPIPTPLTLGVLEKTTLEKNTVAGDVGEAVVQQYELKTASRDGVARQTLRIEKGGRYVLRAEGRDRFQNPVSAETTVKISDDQDGVRLRILADRHTFKVGDAARVNLHWREKPALALVTCEGARVLEYQLVTLQTGANRLPLPISAKLAPNFQLGVAVMTDGHEGPKRPPKRFHSASSPFRVKRDLQVRIAVRPDGEQKGPPKPGDTIQVAITTTDPQGKPVPAELSLAMVEQAALRGIKPRSSRIDKFFRGDDRRMVLRTTSSIDFSCRPRTVPIDALLLSEEERERLSAEESRRLAELVRDGKLQLDAPTADELPTLSPESGSGKESVKGPGAGGGGLAGGFGRSESGPQLGRDRRPDDGRTAPAMQVSENPFGGASEREAPKDAAGLEQPQEEDFDADGAEQDTGWTIAEGPTQSERDAPSVSANGEWSYRSLGRELAGADSRERAMADISRRLAEIGTRLLAQLPYHETGYWNPSIVTDKDGTATVTFPLPDRSTGWTFSAIGVSRDTLSGEAEEDLQVEKDLFGQFKLPQAFTDQDEADIMVSVHNNVVSSGAIDVVLKTTIAEKTLTQRQKLEVERKGVHELAFRQNLELPATGPRFGEPGAEVKFELSVAAGERRDVIQRAAPLRPDGLPVFSVASGSSVSDVTAVVEQPANMPLNAPRLQIVVGPSVERSLFDVVLAPPTWCQLQFSRIAPPVDRTTSDLMASLALQDLIGTTHPSDGFEARALDDRIRAAIVALVALQNEDGGWSWASRQGASNRYAAARIVWALSLAKAAAYEVADEAYNLALNYLTSQMAQTHVSDFDTKAVLLHAMATAGRGDFPLANQLYRNRQSLGSSALAYLCLAMAEMDRKETAAELLELLGRLDPAGELRGVWKAGGSVRHLASDASSFSWSCSAVELHALYALGLEQAGIVDAKLSGQVEWLMGRRTGHSWTPRKAVGPAMLVLCRRYARTKFKDQRYKLTIFVNDQKAEELDIRGGSRTQIIDVAPHLLGKGKQRVRFEINGRGRFAYQCILGGFTPSGQLESTTKNWRVTRYYEPAGLELDGELIPRGFDIVSGPHTEFRNELRHLPLGKRGSVELRVDRNRYVGDAAARRSEYLVVSEPLPAGIAVVENSIQGDFQRYEISPGEITFYLGVASSSKPIRFDVYGYLPGNYRAAPTVVRNAYRANELAVAKAAAITVLPADEESPDPYRLSPRELYELGKRRFERGEYKLAHSRLAELLGNWTLKPAVYQDAVKMLLDSHLRTGPASDVVRYFEIIIAKYPELPISFDSYLKIGDAYRAIGEHERSYLVFRATVEKSFQRESYVAGSIEAQGDFHRSVEFMSDLLRQYPPEPYVASAAYALAQRVYAKVAEAAGDVKLRRQGVTRVDLVRRALSMLDQFLTANPDDPAADQASFTFANGLLELDAYQEAIEACRRYAQRFPDSDFLDSFWYVIGFCHFARGEHQQALEMCQKVSQLKRVDERTGRPKESRNKWRAIYIQGQIHHSLGEAEAAIRQYELVRDRFPDASQAIDYFARKQIELPEVTTIKPSQPVDSQSVDVQLEFRNIASCVATVYRIDLLKFSVLRRNLGGITNINLAGIRPYHRATIRLGDGKDYQDRSTKIPLPLKQEGAYLVVCRGGDLHTSGLVLISPMVVDVQEEGESGRVRATVRDVIHNRYLSGVHVKAIGSRNSEFTSGETDLRGVFVADGIEGCATVIARADGGRYAFYRGKRELGPGSAGGPEVTSIVPGRPTSGKPPQTVPSGKESLLKGLMEGKKEIQQQQLKELEELYKGLEKGGGGMGGMSGGGMGGFGGAGGGGFGGGGIF